MQSTTFAYSPALGSRTDADASPPSAECALECKAVTARHGRIPVCFAIDLEVGRQEILALLGANGAGKSSLLGAIAGLVEGEGTIRVGGQDMTGVPAHHRAVNGVAFVPEIRGNLFSTMTVDENLSIALRFLRGKDNERVRAGIFDMFPILRERLHTAAGMLSGGEQQMLAIAVALGRQPAILLLDEPSQGLAPTIYDTLAEVFGHLKSRGIGIILAEQNLPFAARVADRFVVLAGGRVSMTGPGSALSNQEAILAAYLGEQEAG